MNMLYLVQTILYTGILWIIYMLVLRNRSLHAFNRGYLLVAAMLAPVLPLLQLPKSLWGVAEANRPFNMRLPEITVTDALPGPIVFAIAWLPLVYVIVGLVTLFLVVRSWLQIRKVINSSEAIREGDHTLLLNTGFGPGSWSKYIFLPEGEVNDMIIRHELAHIKLRHSVDIILLHVLRCIFWPNIFLYAIIKELREVHEFQADKQVAGDKETYGKLLVSSIFNSCSLPFAHSFIIHPIKRRLMMLNKGKNKVVNMLAIAAVLLASGTTLFYTLTLQSCKSKTYEVAEAKDVDKMAEFNGDLGAFLGNHIVYPKEAMDNKIEGKVMVEFVVDKDGKVVDPKILSSPNALLSEAALDVIKQMPDWIPAEKKGEKIAVHYQQPIMFKLS